MVRAFLLILLFAPLPGTAALPRVELWVDDVRICVEVAATPSARERGLMYRTKLADNEGMLFVFPSSGSYSLWMKDTLIPLDAAFLDRDGVILRIASMSPGDSTLHSSPPNTAYALEMNRGWFSRRGAAPGSKVQGASEAASASPRNSCSRSPS
jgi:uncharacterized membrane protein (UPF0127 family)